MSFDSRSLHLTRRVQETVQSWQHVARTSTLRGDLRSTMNELTNIIVQKTGISQENAQKSVQVTLGFLKTKLPTPIASQLDSFLMPNPVPFVAKS